jgi:aldose 1-epimerase
MKILSKQKPLIIIQAGILLTLAACKGNTTTQTTTMTDTTVTTTTSSLASGFEQTIDGKQIHLFTLKNKNGIEAKITNYGGRLVSLRIPDKDGNLTEVITGPGSVDGFKKAQSAYFGSTVGRYGNRIAKGHFTLEGKEYTLFINNKPNSLHGGMGCKTSK